MYIQLKSQRIEESELGKKVFEEIIAKYFLNLMKNVKLQTQEDPQPQEE